MRIKKQDILQSNLLGNEKNLEYFISTKPFFIRSPIYEGEYSAQSKQNLDMLGQDFTIPQENIILLHQTHSSEVVIIHESHKRYEADAAITQLNGKMLIVLASDCVPILLYDTKNHAIGVIHAGWRGLDAEIIKNTLYSLQEIFGSQPRDILCYIGPCISQENYEVGADVAEKFLPHFLRSVSKQLQKNNTFLLDVRGIAQQQLLKHGVLEKNIEMSQYCTYREKDVFHSYRRSTQKGEVYQGNNALGIMLK